MCVNNDSYCQQQEFLLFRVTSHAGYQGKIEPKQSLSRISNQKMQLSLIRDGNVHHSCSSSCVRTQGQILSWRKQALISVGFREVMLTQGFLAPDRLFSKDARREEKIKQGRKSISVNNCQPFPIKCWCANQDSVLLISISALCHIFCSSFWYLRISD